MTRTPFSLKSAHLLTWSSPILLLILVFTLTSTSQRVPAASSPPPSSTSPVTTPVPATTTTTITTPTHPSKAIVAATSPKSSSSAEKRFSNVTTSTATPVAPISNVSAMHGALSGTLGPGFETVDVPLLGPGNWTLSTSASTDQSLNCGADTSPVESQVVVGSDQSCQLEIASTSAGASLTWQLTPTS